MQKRLQIIFKTYCQGPFKKYSKRLPDVLQRCLHYIFKTFLRHLQNVFKMCLRCIFKLNTYSIRLQHIMETFRKDDYLQKDLPRLHVWKIYGQVINFPRVNSLDINKNLTNFKKKNFIKWQLLQMKSLLWKSGVR